MTLLFRWVGVLRCPRCGGDFELERDGRQRFFCCGKCKAKYEIVDGIPRLVLAEREKEIENFCAKYDALRLQEGWASEMPEFYLHLPDRDLSGRHAKEWRLRAKSFRTLQNWLERIFGHHPLRILDAGAGNGWTSRHLAEQHEVLALDVNIGNHGLAALPVEKRNFFAVQGELGRLPLADGCIDVAIVNASLHYTANPREFFKEAHRILRYKGKLIVLDSPTYLNQKAAALAHARSREYYAQMGVPELAQNYAGLVASIFSEKSFFNFRYWRRDLDWMESAKKWLHEKIGKPAGARFPMWIGERLASPDESEKPGRSRAGALITHNDKLLTLRDQRHERLRWRIPGGGIKPGETPELAARRELREELNLDISIERPFGRYHRPEKSDWYFLAKAEADTLPPNDFPVNEMQAVVQWLPVQKLIDYDLRPPALKWELVEYFNM